MKRNKANNYARSEAATKCFSEFVSFLYLINYSTELSCIAPLAIGEVFGELISSTEYSFNFKVSLMKINQYRRYSM